MIALQVHITSGPQAGTRLQVSQSPVTFGRSPENTLVLDLTTVSRNHGELRFEEGRWWLHNLSQNGTKVGRKRVTKKPRALEDGASVVIGEDEVFKVYYAADTAPADTAPAADTDEAAAEQPAGGAPGTGLKKRSKLWMILGVWFVLCIGLFVLLATTIGDDDGGDDGGGNKLVRYESPEDVRAILKRPVQRETPDEYRYTQNIERARTAFESREDRNLYEAYAKFREAIRYRPDDVDLNAEDSQRYDLVMDRLAEIIHRRLEVAYTSFGQNHFDDTLTVLDELLELYPGNADDDPVAQQIIMLRGRAAARAGRR